MRVFIVIFLAIWSLAAEAKADILRCSANGREDVVDVKVEVDIVLPTENELDKALTAVTADNGNFVAIVGGVTLKGPSGNRGRNHVHVRVNVGYK